jgi:uncharacterized lipoprotein YddW (UPF0748 family)
MGICIFNRSLCSRRPGGACKFYMQHRVSRAAASLLVAVGFMLPLATSTAQSDTEDRPREVRGVWIPAPQHTGFWQDKASIAREIDYLADTGFNVVFPVVWVGGYTLFPSDVMAERFGEEYRQLPFPGGRDPLRELIVEAHRRGIEVIPWFEYGFSTNFGTTGGHILEKYPHWASRNSSGGLADQNPDAHGVGFKWMSGIHPEVQDFMLDLIREVIENYDIDGVQGDDRLPANPAVGGYEEYTANLYREQCGLEPGQSSTTCNWTQWRADRLTAFAGRLYRMVKEIDTNLTVSMSPSIFSFSLTNYLQDWPRWLDSNYVDIIHPQAYRYDITSYKDLIRQMVVSAPGYPQGHVRPEDRHRLSPGILIKAGSRFNDPEYVLEAVRFNREHGILGEVYFYNEGLREKNQYLADSLAKYFYTEPALMPGRASTWRDALILGLDDSRVSLTGEWIIDTQQAGYREPMRYARLGTGSEARYDIGMPYEGHFDVYAWQPAGGRARTAHYAVIAGEDTTIAVVNQQLERGWTYLATVALEPGLPAGVVLYADSLDTSVDSSPVVQRSYTEAVMLLLNRKLSPDAVVVPTSVVPEKSPRDIPGSASLFGNYPNPFNPSTTIAFELVDAGRVSLTVYDSLGRRAMSLAEDRPLPAGRHEIRADLSLLAGGVYFYRLQTGAGHLTGSMVLLK